MERAECIYALHGNALLRGSASTILVEAEPQSLHS